MTFIRNTLIGLGLVGALASTAHAQRPYCSDAILTYNARPTLEQRAAFVNNDSLDACASRPRHRIIPASNSFITTLYGNRDTTEVQRFGTVSVVIDKDNLTLVAGDIRGDWQSHRYSNYAAAIQLTNIEPYGDRKLPQQYLLITVHGRDQVSLARLTVALEHTLQHSGDITLTDQDRALMASTIQAVRPEFRKTTETTSQ